MIDKSMRVVARALAAGRLETVASGLVNLPSDGPALVVARHYHHFFDGLALFAAIPRQFHVLVALDWVQSRPSKLLMLSLTGLARWPVILRREALIQRSLSEPDRNPGPFSVRDVIRYQHRALLQSVRLLLERRVLVVFPEGYPNVDPVYTPKLWTEEFLPFKPGFVSIITAAEKRLGTTLPIIPLGIQYIPGEAWVARLVFGDAIYRKQFVNTTSLVECAEREVKRLSGLISWPIEIP